MSSSSSSEEDPPERLAHLLHMDKDDKRSCDTCGVLTAIYYENLYDDATHTYICSSCTDKEPQEIVITLRFTQALLHEGGGNSRNACRKCGTIYKRYYRLVLEDGSNAFMCRMCFDGRETGYDNSYNSD